MSLPFRWKKNHVVFALALIGALAWLATNWRADGTKNFITIESQLRQRLNLEAVNGHLPRISFQDRVFWGLGGELFASCGTFHWREANRDSPTGYRVSRDYYYYWSTDEGLLLTDPNVPATEDAIFTRCGRAKARAISARTLPAD